MKHLISKIAFLIFLGNILHIQGQDLKITKFKIATSPFSPIFNFKRLETFSIDIELSNTGNAAVTTSVDFYLSTDSTSLSGSSLSTNANNITIGAGQSISKSYTLTVSSTTPYLTSNPYLPHLYYLIARIDPQNLIVETNESNNKRLSMPISRADLINIVADADIDLDVLSLKEDTIVAGNHTKVIVTARNKGMDPMINYVNYVIYTDSLGGKTIAGLNDEETISFSGVEQKTFEHEIYIPSTIPAGNYYLYAYTSAPDRSGYYDLTRNGNWKSTKITIAPSKLDLFTSQLSLESTVAMPNAEINISATEETKGNGYVQEYNTSYYLSTDTVYDSDDRYLTSYHIYFDEPQHLITYSIKTYMPNVMSGNYYILAVINSGNQVVETNVANNTKYTPVTVGVVTGIDSENFLQTLSLYPNPSTGMVYLQSGSQEEASVEVYNASNQLVFEETKVGDRLALEHLPEGLYLVKIKRENGTVASQKIVINK